MNKNPEIADQPALNVAPADIPYTSPYYDKIRSLKMERDFASFGSPERQWIELQISEMTQRAQQRVAADMSINV